MPNTTTQVALIQMSCEKDPKANLAKVLEKITLAAKKGAKIICLQELFQTLYFCQTEDTKNFSFAEKIPSETTITLAKVAKENEIVIIASLFEKRAPGVFHNTTIVIDADGKVLGKYRKMHIPDDPGFYEKFYFTPGDLGFKTFETKYAKIGVCICWDQWFPEAARLTAMQGAKIIFYPTAIGWQKGEIFSICKKQHDAWETIQRSHAIANGVYIAATNRVGQEDDLIFWGQSFVVDPFGGIINKASKDKEEILITECDFNKVDEIRQLWPFFRDRRIDSYGQIDKKWIDQ